MAKVLPVPGPHLVDTRPVKDLRPMGAPPGRASLLLLRWQGGEHLVDGMVESPASHHGVMPRGGHDVEDIHLLQLVPPALAEAMGRQGQVVQLLSSS